MMGYTRLLQYYYTTYPHTQFTSLHYGIPSLQKLGIFRAYAHVLPKSCIFISYEVRGVKELVDFAKSIWNS